MCKKKVVPCEIYSRVVGYFRPVSQWNRGKQQEFRERKYTGIGNFYFRREKIVEEAGGVRSR
jgi:hypothetical protein